ncbi:MAG: 3-phenylpropionate/cinnamic acid dioxygenase subunit beta [Chloroflexota bacterium]|nr:3-phenylpropionate/cinnamic acid dioxygenase subunit beta [Chloroflexota bacterium]MDE2885461.1 3-phenylpropionate/cinnamic acid dioxygenase subunit beta [Chloroflexota bacterium]
MSSAVMESIVLKHEIEELFSLEAELLDSRHFEEWLDLFTDDVRYWMPLHRNVKAGEWERERTRETVDVSWIDDDKLTLTQRVKQIRSGIHWAEEPISRLTHIVANIRVVDVTDDEVKTTSRFLVYRNRVETETDILVGKREDTLRKVDGNWMVARRVILLDQSVLLPKNLTFFI